MHNQQPGPQEYFTISGVNLEIKRYSGAKDMPTLVFLHEGLGCVDIWHDFPERLARLTDCPVLVYSRQGYGRSDPCAVPRPLDYLLKESLEVLPAVLAAADIEDHVLIGHSDGGSISLIYAGAQERKGLRGIISMAPHVFCEQVSMDSIALARESFFEGGLRDGMKKYHYDNVDCAFLGWNGAWLDPDFMGWNIEGYLPGIKVPQLVMQGEDDQYGTIAQVDSIAKKSGGPVTVHMLPGCGHAPYKEQKQQSLDIMQAYLNDIIQEVRTA